MADWTLSVKAPSGSVKKMPRSSLGRQIEQEYAELQIPFDEVT